MKTGFCCGASNEFTKWCPKKSKQMFPESNQKSSEQLLVLFAGAATHSQSIATDQSRCRHRSRQPQCIITQRVRSKIIMAKNRGRHQERAKDLRKRCRRQKLLTVRGISKLVLSKRASRTLAMCFPIKHIVSRVCVPTRTPTLGSNVLLLRPSVLSLARESYRDTPRINRQGHHTSVEFAGSCLELLHRRVITDDR